jgi:outer membrane protein assembly factor BamB
MTRSAARRNGGPGCLAVDWAGCHAFAAHRGLDGTLGREGPRKHATLRLILALALFAPLRLCETSSAADWHSWRGPEQNGVSREKDLPDRFTPELGEDSNVVWKVPFGGRSTPIVMNGRVYIINRAGEGLREQERVMCFQADSGKLVHEYRFNVFYTDIVSARLGWTNLAGDPETGNIYAHGVQGLFFCFDKDLKVLWSRSLTEEYGRVSGYGGRVNSPTVDGDLVIIGMPNASWGDQARTGDRYLAMNKRTGEPVWWATLPGVIRGTYYSNPVIAVIGGERLLITGGSGGGVHALKVRTGEVVWSYVFGAKAINTSPVVQGNLVYAAHGEENIGSNVQGRVVCLDASKVKNKKPHLVWKRDGITVKFSSPVIHEDRLYVCDEGGLMFCLAAKTGKILWRAAYGTAGSGSPVWADGKIYVAEAGPNFSIIPLKKDGSKPRARRIEIPSPDGVSSVEINGSPAVANGRIYFTATDEFYCIGKKEWNGKSDPIPPTPPEIAGGRQAAHVQVVPADVVLKPGEKVKFKARTFNSNGQFLKEVEAEWSLPRPPVPEGAREAPPALQGDIGSDGTLRVSTKLPGQYGLVQASAGGLTGRARVRVAPALPYHQDFSKVPVGRFPGGWVNVAGKFVVVEHKGAHVLKKTNANPNPLLARARTYISVPTLKDYTIEAEMMGTRRNGNMPDMGVSANRYTLFLDGNKQWLRLTSWSALPRVDEHIRFAWKPDVWYRMKFTAVVQDGKGVVRGKVWPRGDKEPKNWTIEFTDPVPNTAGSPALYGYSTGILGTTPGTEGSEVLYASVTITPNQNQKANRE